MTIVVEHLERGDLFELVEERQEQLRAFLNWAENREVAGHSMYLANRSDIQDARQAAAMYADPWWGIVVFTCFGCLNSTSKLQEILARPIDREHAETLLNSIEFTRPKVGHHRTQQGLTGAKKAVLAACQSSNFLCDVLHSAGSFDDRYQVLLNEGLATWARTTCFDFLLRTGALGIGGNQYAPEIAYLVESTGPVTDRVNPAIEDRVKAGH